MVDDIKTDDGVSVADLIRRSLDSLSAGERKVARTILADYPIVGLETVAELARRANVSSPTVVRFTTRLGFAGHQNFQRQLMREVQERLGSPLEQYNRPDLRSDDGNLARAARTFAASISNTIAELPDSEFERTVQMLADPRRPVRLAGGRFSQLLAQYLASHLELLRPDVQIVPTDEVSRLAAAADAGRTDVYVVFDYRRYDTHVVRLAQRVADRGADVVLFTDRWLSPVADVASTVLPAYVDAPSPFDSLTPAMAVVETIIAGVTDRLGETGRQRIEAMEAMRTRTVTERPV